MTSLGNEFAILLALVTATGINAPPKLEG